MFYDNHSCVHNQLDKVNILYACADIPQVIHFDVKDCNKKLEFKSLMHSLGTVDVNLSWYTSYCPK